MHIWIWIDIFYKVKAKDNRVVLLAYHHIRSNLLIEQRLNLIRPFIKKKLQRGGCWATQQNQIQFTILPICRNFTSINIAKGFEVTESWPVNNNGFALLQKTNFFNLTFLTDQHFFFACDSESIYMYSTAFNLVSATYISSSRTFAMKILYNFVWTIVLSIHFFQKWSNFTSVKVKNHKLILF